MITARIIAPENVAITDGTFRVKVNVDYTFGKTAHGVAVISFKRYYNQVVFKKTLNIGSSDGIFEVNIEKDLGITSEDRVEINLVFTDKMSDKKTKASANIKFEIFSTVLNLEFPQHFKSNQLIPFTVSVIRHDGIPVRCKTIDQE